MLSVFLNCFHLSFEADSSQMWRSQIGWTSWHRSPKHLPVSTSPVLRLTVKVHATTLVYYMNAGDLNTGLHVCRIITVLAKNHPRSIVNSSLISSHRRFMLNFSILLYTYSAYGCKRASIACTYGCH